MPVDHQLSMRFQVSELLQNVQPVLRRAKLFALQSVRRPLALGVPQTLMEIVTSTTHHRNCVSLVVEDRVAKFVA